MVENALGSSVPTLSIVPVLLLAFALLLSNIRLSRQLTATRIDELDPVTDSYLRWPWTRRAERLLNTLADPVVVFIDVNNLKPVNDTLGHDAGDSVLWELVDRLRATFGPDALIGRIGGDEFAVLLNNKPDGNWRATLELAAAACVVNVADTEHGAAFGVARCVDLLAGSGRRHNKSMLARLMRAADLAQMRAKRRCSDEGMVAAVAFYDETIDGAVPLQLDNRPWTRGRDAAHRPVRTGY